mmetsp:Transcript_20115/g.66592  ORF Transcript_20115/g.66592 Transcript_20115/m.66592 type:complete len:358 (+) Transcript_20115:349-1422(+)
MARLALLQLLLGLLLRRAMEVLRELALRQRLVRERLGAPLPQRVVPQFPIGQAPQDCAGRGGDPLPVGVSGPCLAIRLEARHLVGGDKGEDLLHDDPDRHTRKVGVVLAGRIGAEAPQVGSLTRRLEGEGIKAHTRVQRPRRGEPRVLAAPLQQPNLRCADHELRLCRRQPSLCARLSGRGHGCRCGKIALLPEDRVVHQRRPCLRQLRQGSIVGSPRSVADRVLVLTQLPLAVQFVGALPGAAQEADSRVEVGRDSPIAGVVDDEVEAPGHTGRGWCPAERQRQLRREVVTLTPWEVDNVRDILTGEEEEQRPLQLPRKLAREGGAQRTFAEAIRAVPYSGIPCKAVVARVVIHQG